MIWFSLFIPIVVFLITFVKFNKFLVWQEVVGMLVAPILLILICRNIGVYSKTRDIEYWGGWVTKAEYYEDWDEYIQQTCTRNYPCGTDSNGNTEWCTEIYDCSYVQYHPEFWQVCDSNGEDIGVSQAKFEELAKRWNSRQFVDLNRNYYSNDGDKYVATGTKDRSLIEPTSVAHTWTNQVQASRSIFRFPDVNPAKYILFQYPQIVDYYKQVVLLGDESTSTVKAAESLAYYDAVLGAKKRMRCFILVFKDKPVDAGLEQQAFWQGGNKNEFVITIGVDKDMNVQWCYPFSWSDREQLKVEVKDQVLSMQKLNLQELVEWLAPQLESKFVKCNFHEFDYLKIDPPVWAIVLTFVLTAVVSIGIAIFSVTNEWRKYE